MIWATIQLETPLPILHHPRYFFLESNTEISSRPFIHPNGLCTSNRAPTQGVEVLTILLPRERASQV